MKKKTLKRLVITKETVANLSDGAMRLLQGGTLAIKTQDCYTATKCEGRPCMTVAVEYCSIVPTCGETEPIACP